MNAYRSFFDYMSKSELHEVESRLVAIFDHMLKIAHIKGQIGLDNARGWTNSIVNQQEALTDHFRDFPGLKPKLTPAVLNKSYKRALRELCKRYPSVNFPSSNEFPLGEVLGPRLMAMIRKR